VKELQEYLRKLLALTESFEKDGADCKALEFQAYRSLRIRAAHESIRHKHSAFEHEKEWRMVVFGRELRHHHRPCRAVPAPYFPFDLAEPADRLPIQEVRVGPAHASAGTAVAAVMGSSDLLRDKCMRTDWINVVTASEIPYQPWSPPGALASVRPSGIPGVGSVLECRAPSLLEPELPTESCASACAQLAVECSRGYSLPPRATSSAHRVKELFFDDLSVRDRK